MRQNRLKLTALIAAITLFAGVLAGCAESPSSDQTPGQSQDQTATQTPDGSPGYTVKFAAFPGYSGLGTALGVEKGFYAENGLEVEFNYTTGDKVALLLSGDADFADYNTSNVITAIAKGAPIKIVGSFFRTKGPFHVLVSHDIQTAADLKGKTIGIGVPGSGLEATIRHVLSEAGLDPDKDATLVANGVFQDAYASLQNDQVDATVIHEPFVALAESEGIGHLLVKGYEVLPDLHTGVLVASDKFIEEHPEELRKILESYYKSWIYARENLDETIAFGSEYINVDAAVLEAALQSELEIWENIPQVNLDAINTTQDIQIELGFQDEKHDISGSIDESFLPDEETLARFKSEAAQQ